MPRDLPPRASLEHLRKQAKDLLRDIRRGEPDATRRVAEAGVAPGGGAPRLADAQRVIAREYGYRSWAALRRHVEGASPDASATPDDGTDAMLVLSQAVRERNAAGVAAALRRHPELARRLDEAMPGGHFGATALLSAVGQGDRATVDVLLDAGADINARSHWWAGGFGVLDGEHGLTDNLIARGVTIDAHAAARLGMVERLEALLAEDPSLVHARGGDGQTPLHFAANVSIAQLLLDRGADINARDVDHESTPAQWMVRERQDVARFLASRGAATDILMAAALGDVALVRQHLDADPAAIETTVSARWFPMRDPRAGGSIYIWTLGAYQSAFTVAREFGHEDVLQLLLERSSDELRLVAACDLGDADDLARLLVRRPDLARAIPLSAHAALVHAADTRRFDAVRLMLDAGWPVDARDEHGATALHWSAWHGNAGIVRALLRRGAPLDVREGRHDARPLDWAIHGSVNCWHQDDTDHAAVVEALLGAGAPLPSLSPEFKASDDVTEVVRRRMGRDS